MFVAQFGRINHLPAARRSHFCHHSPSCYCTIVQLQLGSKFPFTTHHGSHMAYCTVGSHGCRVGLAPFDSFGVKSGVFRRRYAGSRDEIEIEMITPPKRSLFFCLGKEEGKRSVIRLEFIKAAKIAIKAPLITTVLPAVDCRNARTCP